MHDINEAFNEFFTSTEKNVLLLKGKWGSGKTHFWESSFSKYIYLDDTLKYYTYTSVYGKSGLDELQKDILFSIRSIDNKNKTLKNERLKALKFTSSVPAIKEKLFEYTGGIFFSWIVDNLDNSVIVIDDIERISDKIEKKEFWGFVSSLKRNDNKIVIISNIDSESDKALLNQQIEKNVDIEVEIIPNLIDLIDTLFSEEFYSTYRNKLFEIASELKLENIRALIKLKSFCNYLIKISDKALKHFISDIAFYCLIKYRANNNLPLYEEVPDDIHLFYMLNEDLSQEQKEFYSSAARHLNVENPLAKRCIKMLVEAGYIESESKIELIAYLEKLYVDRDLMKAYDEAWDYYHNSFDNNSILFAEKLHNGFIINVHQLSINSLNTVYRLLIELGHPDEADDCVVNYFRVNEALILENMKNPISLSRDFHSDIDKIREHIDQLKQKSSERRTIGEVLSEITFSSGWNPRDIIDLASYEVHDYVDFFKSTKSNNLDSYIKRLLKFGNFQNPEQEMKDVAEKAKEALKIIAAEGGLNQMRIEKKYSIKPGDGT